MNVLTCGKEKIRRACASSRFNCYIVLPIAATRGMNMYHDLSRKVLSYRWLIFVIMASVYFTAFFHRVCPAVIALDIQETFNISAELVGLLASAYFYSYAIIQFPAGLLSDSFGPRKSVTLFTIIGAAGSILFGLAPNIETALVGRVLVGLGAGMVFAPTMKILSSWFRVNEFTKMNAIFLATGGVGALSAAEPLALITGWLGWRTAFDLFGAAALLFGVLLWFLVRDRPQDFGWPSLAQIDPVYGQSLAPRQQIGLWEGVRRVLGEKYFWPIAGWSFFSMGTFFFFRRSLGRPLPHAYLRDDQSGSRKHSKYVSRRNPLRKPFAGLSIREGVPQQEERTQALFGYSRCGAHFAEYLSNRYSVTNSICDVSHFCRLLFGSGRDKHH